MNKNENYLLGKEAKFPIIKAGHIFNKLNFKVDMPIILNKQEVEIEYPCRLDAMAINPAAVCYNDSMIFTPGEVVISLKKFIKVKITVKSESGGQINISKRTKRKVLVKHSYLLMCNALNVFPSLDIDVDDNDIPKHCGFGSSSSTISAVASAINELYSCPINDKDLIKYLASNHGEEISDNDEENLKVVQCIGGGATNGLTEEGIIIIAGKSTAIAKMKYESEVLIGFPNDFVQKDAKVLMELEEKNLWKFKKTGEEYAEKIAYDLLHKALPDMANGNIKELADVVFDYRFNMGSNENCSFVYDGLMNISDKIRKLYENSDCEFLALSSVGPAFFVLVKNENQKKKCKEFMEKLDLKVIESSVCNTKYIVSKFSNAQCFWENENVGESFRTRKPSKYITNEIDALNVSDKKCIDIGCGGGRYSKYLQQMKANVLSIDKYKEMFDHSSNINFIQCKMDNIPVIDNSYYLVLSIGVIHNAVTIDEYKNSLKEIYRILDKNGYAILSTFTNDIVTSDLIKTGENTYSIKDRPRMVLLSKDQVQDFVSEVGFKIIKIVNEHITDVGSGKRNVYTILIKKQ